MKFKVDIKMPDLSNLVKEMPFKCPSCKKEIKLKVLNNKVQKIDKCPHCKTPIKWTSSV